MQTSLVVDGLWDVMVKPALREGWKAVFASSQAGSRRVWFVESSSLSDVSALEAAFELRASALDPAAPSFATHPLAWSERQQQGRLTTLRRKTDAAGSFLVGVVSAEDVLVGEPALQTIADLWNVALAAELAAEQQNELLREQQAIVEHIADGLLVVDRDLIVKHMNAAAGRILNLNPRTSVGKPFGSLLDFQPIIQPILDSGEGYVDRELIINSPHRHLHLIDTAVPIKDRNGRVVSIVNSFREIQRVRSMANRLAGNHARYTFDSVIGVSPPLLKAVESARKAARGFANVLLLGKSGVGKEVFAQAIHNASSRNAGPFIAINCAALPRDLIESELFGYVGGSFTGASREGRPGKFEAASGGTIFLDEISELPIDVQAKLLRVLQEREVVRVGDTRGIPIDVRVISASNRDLVAMSRSREFREDLYYRCHVIGIHLPALAERREDVPVLVNHFLRKYSQLLNKRVYQVAPEAMQLLTEYAWPGNVRELENAIERLVNMVDAETIEVEDISDLPVAMDETIGLVAAALTLPAKGSVRALKATEHEAVALALEECGFNVAEAARRLGISKPTLYAKIRSYQIPLLRAGQKHAQGD